MKKTWLLLVASTALTAAIGVPAWSAMHAPADGSFRPFTALFEEGEKTTPLVLASDDDDDCRGSAPNPAPAGTIAPPQVQVN